MPSIKDVSSANKEKGKKKRTTTKSKINNDVEKWNSKDLLDYWKSKYKEVFGEEYSQYGFVGNSMKALKELLEEYDIYSIILAVDVCLEQDECRQIEYFAKDIDKYLVQTNYARYHYLIGKLGTDEFKNDLLSLAVLENSLLPTAKSERKIRELIERFDEFLVTKGIIE